MAAAAAAACCVDLHGLPRRGIAYQPVCGLRHFLVAGALNSKKNQDRKGAFRCRHLDVTFYKSRGPRISEFGLRFAVQQEGCKSLCSRRLWCDGLRSGDKRGRTFLVPASAIATEAADWDSRWEDSRENREEFWRIWSYKPTSTGERLAVLGIFALTGLVVLRVLRGSSLLSVGAIVLFLCLGGFHNRFKPALFILTEKLQHLRGSLIRRARLMPFRFKQQTLGTIEDNMLGNSHLLGAPTSIPVDGTSIECKDVADCVNHLTSIIEKFDSEVSTEEVLSVSDLINLQLGMAELRVDLYRAASALHAKENLLHSKLQNTPGSGSQRIEVHRNVPAHKVVSNFEIITDDSGCRGTLSSSDLNGSGGVHLTHNEESASVVDSDSSGYSNCQRGLHALSNSVPARKGVFHVSTYEVITDYKLEPVAHLTPVGLKTQATAGSLLSQVAASEVVGEHEKSSNATQNLQELIQEQIKRGAIVAVGTPESGSDFSEQPNWSHGDSLDVKTGSSQKWQKLVIEDEFAPSFEAQSLSVTNIVADEPGLAHKLNREDDQPMNIMITDKASTDPWHDDDSRGSSSLVMDENEDFHWERLQMQEIITPSPSGRWTDDDHHSSSHESTITKGMYKDGGGQARGNLKPSVDFWGNKTVNAGRAERGTLTRIKATRGGSLGSVDDVDNELPQKRGAGWKDKQMSQGQVRRRDSAEGAGQQTTTGQQYVQDEGGSWDNEFLIDAPVSGRRSIGGSRNYQESERDWDNRKVSADDREWSHGGRDSQNKRIMEEGDYRSGRNPDGRYYSEERSRAYNSQDDRQMLNEEEEVSRRSGARDIEDGYFGNESRSGIPDDEDASQNGGDLGGNYGSQMRMISSSRDPLNSRKGRQSVEEDDEEDYDEEDDRYRREALNLEEEEQDYGSGRRSRAESSNPGRDVQRGSDYDSERVIRSTDLPPYVQSEIEPEGRNLPVRQPSRMQLEKFDRLLDEGEALLEEGMQGLEGRIEVGVAERMLYEAASLFEAAAEIDPSSLIAVGFWGNTLLVHGELKLKLSQQLRSMLPLSNSYSITRGRVGAGRDDQLESLELTLQNVCEECEELLVDAGRKYRMALSLDRTDMRALYNWGLALCYRGQLIADEGGERAIQDADKVYLAAIDKFEAMLGISQEYAAGALYNWGLAMRDRARLRSMGDRDRVKLLLQAKELFQDAVRLDPNNGQARGAVTAAGAELQELKRFEDMQSEQEINGRSPRSWWE